MEKDREWAKEKVGEMSFAEKIKHYWGYYKYRISFVILVFFLIGCSAYMKLSQSDYVLNVSIYAENFTEKSTEENIQRVFSKWISEAKKDEKECDVGIKSAVRPRTNGLNTEELLAVNTKLTAELEGKQKCCFILEKSIYMEFFENGGYGFLVDADNSGEISETGKKYLKLDEKSEFYFVTLSPAEESRKNEKYMQEYKNSVIVFKKLKEMQ